MGLQLQVKPHNEAAPNGADESACSPSDHRSLPELSAMPALCGLQCQLLSANEAALLWLKWLPSLLLGQN